MTRFPGSSRFVGGLAAALLALPATANNTTYDFNGLTQFGTLQQAADDFALYGTGTGNGMNFRTQDNWSFVLGNAEANNSYVISEGGGSVWAGATTSVNKRIGANLGLNASMSEVIVQLDWFAFNNGGTGGSLLYFGLGDSNNLIPDWYGNLDREDVHVAAKLDIFNSVSNPNVFNGLAYRYWENEGIRSNPSGNSSGEGDEGQVTTYGSNTIRDEAEGQIQLRLDFVNNTASMWGRVSSEGETGFTQMMSWSVADQFSTSGGTGAINPADLDTLGLRLTRMGVDNYRVYSSRVANDLNVDLTVSGTDIDHLRANNGLVGGAAVLDGVNLDINGSGTVEAGVGTTGAAVSDVTAYLNSIGSLYGDANLNGSVGFEDVTPLAANFGASNIGWAGGDYDGSGAGDFGDVTTLAATFGMSGPVATAASVAASAVPTASAVQLVVDVNTGELKLVGGGESITSFEITSASGSLIADPDGIASPFALYFANTSSQIVAFGTTPIAITELLLDAGFNINGQQDLVFSYGIPSSTAPVSGDVSYIPEPASLMLLGLGGLALIGRRRKLNSAG